ncbi:putative transferase CAF17, mitochondrial [Podospora fimiseda]|uniref:Iron-sulfur cluster assembly factor IBA57 homolog, mitochondrial n=1 Tax=Podospora fimiseda TaxID=252190 RepID=A0AAN7BJP8_9PEZI|nr:putative transferase CAF17, mitochondrial [Podospora fimiseda]
MQPLRRIVSSHVGRSSLSNPIRVFTCRLAFQHSPIPVQFRSFSGTVPRRHQDPIPSAALSSSGICHLTSRSLIKVSGPDAAKFLQGVITSNLFTSLGPQAQVRTNTPGFYSAFLTAQGRILHDVFIYLQSPEQFLIEVDANEAEKLSKHIKRYKLRAKFDVSVLSGEEVKVWHVFTGAAFRHEGLCLPERHKEDGMIILPDPRAYGMGIRVISTSSSDYSSRKILDPLPVVPEKAYTVHRYLLGVAEGQSELLYGASLPHESNMDVMNAIDFRKGCYVGQELTIRTEHRGVVRKRVLPCILGGTSWEKWGFEESGGAERIDTGANLTKVEGEGEGAVKKRSNAVGKWLKGVGNLGLAVVRMEEAGVLEGESGIGKEFVVVEGEEGGDGEKVRVRPFLPGWLRNKLIEKVEKP